MARILKIENDVLSIGKDDGGLTEIRLSDCNFNPNVGDEVNIFSSEDKTVCVKAEPKKVESSDASDLLKNGGININLTQNQGSNNTGTPDMYYNIGNKRAVGKMPYILWAIFLGGLGAHKFYAGKPGQGILYFFFCWTYIPAFLGLIEGIIACFQNPDNYGRILV